MYILPHTHTHTDISSDSLSESTNLFISSATLNSELPSRKEGLYGHFVTPKVLSTVLSPATEPSLHTFDNFNPYSNPPTQVTKQIIWNSLTLVNFLYLIIVSTVLTVALGANEGRSSI